jgi:hypothetical protein
MTTNKHQDIEVDVITEAAIALARRNRDGSVNLDSVNDMIEKLLAAADIILNAEPYEPPPPAPKPKPLLRLVPKSAP